MTAGSFWMGFVVRPDVNLVEEVDAGVRQVAGQFHANELAYLALTSKSEGHVRDRLAWLLHQRLEQHGLLVAREWRRIDLAILDSETLDPVALVEAKFFYSVNAADGMGAGSQYGDQVRNDLAKMHDKAPDAELYAWAIVTHVEDVVPDERLGLVKYAGALNRAMTQHASPAALLEAAQRELTSGLQELGDVTKYSVGQGRAFDIPVSVEAWIVHATDPPQ